MGNGYVAAGVAIVTFLCVWNASKSKIILDRVAVFNNLTVYVFVIKWKKKITFKKS